MKTTKIMAGVVSALRTVPSEEEMQADPMLRPDAREPLPIRERLRRVYDESRSMRLAERDQRAPKVRVQDPIHGGIRSWSLPRSPANPHPHLTFRIVAVGFRDHVQGMREQDAQLTHERKAEIIRRWTPLIGRIFAHVIFPEGVDFRPVWGRYVRLEEFRWIENECPHCTRPFGPAIANMRTR
jgi:hypothetical protein